MDGMILWLVGFVTDCVMDVVLIKRKGGNYVRLFFE